MIIKKRSYPFTIQTQDVDFLHRATIVTMVDALLSTANQNANDNGFGLCCLNEMQCTWALIRLSVEIDEFPNEYDTITIETWVEKVEQFLTTRNFLIRNAAGTITGRAASHWVMFDLKTRRLKDLKILENMHLYAENIPALKDESVKLPPVKGNVFNSFRVKYSDIDVNIHVNSMRYIEWICDYFSLETYRNKTIKRFEINYLNEILFDEVVIVAVEETCPNDFYFEIRKTDKAACRARIVFKE